MNKQAVLYKHAESAHEVRMRLGPDDIPPNLVYPKVARQSGENLLIKSWWDLGESGLLLIMNWNDGEFMPAEVEFKVLNLYSTPYCQLMAPEAELRGATSEDGISTRTLIVQEAANYLTGTIECTGEVYLNFPNYPFTISDKKEICITLHWYNVEEFGKELTEIVRRLTYEASKAIYQIGEDLNIDFEKTTPYPSQPRPSESQRPPSNGGQEVGDTEKENTPWWKRSLKWTGWGVISIICAIGLFRASASVFEFENIGYLFALLLALVGFGAVWGARRNLKRWATETSKEAHAWYGISILGVILFLAELESEPAKKNFWYGVALCAANLGALAIIQAKLLSEAQRKKSSTLSE
jgi:hypothetical protein